MTAALWLLTRCGVDPALVGDLVEQHRAGRSSVWFAWQATTAIVLANWTGIWQHKLLTVRAVVLGLLVAEGLRYFVSAPLWTVVMNTSTNYGYYLSYMSYVYMFAWVPLTKCARLALTAWVTGRLHQPYGVSMVLALAVTLAIWSAPEAVPEVYRLLRDVSEHSRFVPYLGSYVVNSVAATAGLGIGALLSTRSSRLSTPISS